MWNWFWSCVELHLFLDTRSDSKIARKDGTTEVARGPTGCFCIRIRPTAEVPGICTCTVVCEGHHVAHWQCNWREKVNSLHAQLLISSIFMLCCVVCPYAAHIWSEQERIMNHFWSNYCISMHSLITSASCMPK